LPESLHFAVPDCRAQRDGTALEPTWVWGLEIMAVGVLLPFISLAFALFFFLIFFRIGQTFRALFSSIVRLLFLAVSLKSWPHKEKADSPESSPMVLVIFLFTSHKTRTFRKQRR